MKVLMAPDYRDAVPYQEQLAKALDGRGVEVAFTQGYRRGLPLWRALKSEIPSPDLIHLHWPESFFNAGQPYYRLFRVLRYPIDLRLAARSRPVIWTAHNLLPHNRNGEPGIAKNMRLTVQKASAVIAHSAGAKDQLLSSFGLPAEKCHVIPHGDQSCAYPLPMDRVRAERIAGLENNGDKRVLMFGPITPYKGVSEVVEKWSRMNGAARLYVVGSALNAKYAADLERLAAGNNRVCLHFCRNWLSETELAAWLSSVDAVVFNYRTVFTSGAASLARSCGIPILLPNRLDTVDLGEPHSHVFRFDSLDSVFEEALASAMAVEPSWEAGRTWRENTSWSHVGALTQEVYDSVLEN